MERWAAKVISLFVIFFVVFAITLLPIKVYGIVARYGARGVHLISCLMCFGGGVFLGVYMLHMAPDVRNIFDEAIVHPRRITYPIADCVMVGGFFMMVFFESLIKHIRSINDGDDAEDGNASTEDAVLDFDKKPRDQNNNEHHVRNNHKYKVIQELAEQRLLIATSLTGPKTDVLTLNEPAIPDFGFASSTSGIYTPPTPLILHPAPTRPRINSTHSTLGINSEPSTPSFFSAPTTPKIYSAPATPSATSSFDRRTSVFGYQLRGGVRLDLRADSSVSDSTPVVGQHYQTTSKTTTAGREYVHIELTPQCTGGDEVDNNRNYHINMTRSMTLLFALSLHNVFEGLSIGLKQTVSSVWNLTIAILAHEVVIAFSLGMQMAKIYRSVRKIVLAAAMCSSMVPLGMFIGLCITETGQLDHSVSSLTANGVLQGLATGVFIYVTFFEILRGELGHGKAGIDQMFFMLFGFVVLALLAMVPDDKGASWNHHHVHEHDPGGEQPGQLGTVLTDIVGEDGSLKYNTSRC